MRAMALPTPPAPTRRMRMRNILDLVTATHCTSRHVRLSQLKSLRSEQIDARTVASRVREAHELATEAPAWGGRAGYGGSCLGGAESKQVTAGVRHWWGDARDRAGDGRPGRVTARKVRNGHRADHCGAAGRQG